MIETKIAELKRILVTATRLHDIWDCFFETLVNDSKFMAAGEAQAKLPPILQTILAELVRRIIPNEEVALEIQLFRLDEFKFYHGGVRAGLRFGNIIYFESDDVGAFSLATPDGQTNTARFSSQAVRGKKRNLEPSAN